MRILRALEEHVDVDVLDQVQLFLRGCDAVLDVILLRAAYGLLVVALIAVSGCQFFVLVLDDGNDFVIFVQALAKPLGDALRKFDDDTLD